MLKVCLLFGAVLTVAASSEQDRTAQINNFYNELNVDGSWRYGYETSNGIYAQETGQGGRGSSGSLQYYSPDGTPIQLTWTADEFGFHPQGAHLPTPPPVPPTILRALDYIRLNPQQNQQQQQQQPQQQQPQQFQQQGK